MSPEKMIRMSNQIATFFHSKPHDQGVTGVANHISDFWDPRMRNQLFAHIDAGGADLDALVLDAAPTIRRQKAA